MPARNKQTNKAAAVNMNKDGASVESHTAHADHKRGCKPSEHAPAPTSAAAPAPAAAAPAAPLVAALNMSDLNRPAAPSPAVRAPVRMGAMQQQQQQQQQYYTGAPAAGYATQQVPYSAAGAGATASGGISGFRATVPPSPAHAASSAILGSGSHQEMMLPLSEAAPELFGGNPAASTPHYDAIGATGTNATVRPLAAAPAYGYAPAATMNFGAVGGVTPVYAAAGFTPSYTSSNAFAGGVAPSPSALRATVAPSPAHAASTTILGSGSHQEMVLPLSEAAPELFGGNPAASTPHYDAIGAANSYGTTPSYNAAPGLAAAAGYMGGGISTMGAPGPAALPPVFASTASPFASGGMIRGSAPAFAPPSMAAGPAAHMSGFHSIVPPSPAHGASDTMLTSGGHQEMTLPLSEAAPELFGGNPAASTPHYDAVLM